ncbi:ATP-binding protein [Eggerthella sinensis]|uniref:ATP-binding protein n=1 Tax=Eggerthella sinensis TaxID=242230 RepID=UPI00266BEB24|nr:ATP-binding protein [Eggerthella sinensis]
MKSSVSLRVKFIVLLVSVIVAMLGMNVLWQQYSGGQRTEQELTEQARALSSNMDAVWFFMTANQDLINYDSAGNYEFKGLQCSIAGRSIGALFSRATDYRTSYVSLSPRNDFDEPDPFERAGLEAFASDPQLSEYYEYDESDEGTYFRYLRRMNMETSCLQCHGEPVGELDVTGYPKEGLREGDLYGAISLAIPANTYIESARTTMEQSVFLSALAIIASISIIWIALSSLVTAPIAQVKRGMERFEKGAYDTRLQPEKFSKEIQVLTHGFNNMADELEKSHAVLEDTVEERTQELSQANAKLEAQRHELAKTNSRLADENQYKSDFLAMMSHELKTPLAASMAFSGILKERSRPSADDEQLWAELEMNNQTLLAMIDNILVMARLEAGKEQLQLELTDMVDVVSALQSTIDALARRKGVSVAYDIADGIPLFAADAEKLHRIAENLAGNAVKFTDEGGRVLVACRYDDAREQVVLEVADTGIGIERDDLARIFDKFTQADGSISRSYGGSGLGLAMCKELVELHEGSIDVASTPGVGSTFTVHIPANLPLTGADEGADHA